MKHLKTFITVWLILLSILIAFSSFAQTDNYSCNVVCLNEPSHVMEGVKVDLFNLDNQLIGTTYTDDQGYFYFEELLIGESYTAKFEYDAENIYVDLEDAISILFYVVGLIDFDEIQMIAADVDGNEEVDFADFYTVMIDYFIRQQPFPVGDWILQDWEFTLYGNKATGGPAGGILAGQIEIDDDDEKASYFVHTEYKNTISFDGLNTVKVPVYLNLDEEISGVAIIAEFNDDLFELIKIESPIEDINYHVKNGEIRFGWAYTNKFINKSKKAIVNVFLKQKKFSKYENIEKLNILDLSHVLDSKGNKIEYVDFSSSQLKAATISNDQAISVFPNPCKDYFYIQLDESFENAELKLYNSLGQIEIKGNINNKDMIKISTAEMQKGIYYYHINNQSKSITGPISIR